MNGSKFENRRKQRNPLVSRTNKRGELQGLNSELVTGSRVIRIWKVASSGLDNTVPINNHPQD